MKITGVALSDYASRRERILKALKGSIGVVFAGDGAPQRLFLSRLRHVLRGALRAGPGS